MSCKVKLFKKKRLFEEGEANQQNQNAAQAQPAQNNANANNAQAPAQASGDNNQQQGQQAPQQNTAQAQPAQNQQQQNAQNQNQNQNQQGNNQQQEQNQQKEDPKVAERREKVTNCINGIKNIIQQNNPYALIAFDLPKYIESQVPNFANDQDAKETMTKWEAFKNSPSEQTFNDMMTAFATFGNGGQPVQDNNQQQGQQAQQQNAAQAQPAQNQQNAQQNNGANESFDPVLVQQSSEYKSATFGQRINERLEEELKIRHTAQQINEYKSRFGF